MITAIILAFLGMTISFLSKYGNRRNKSSFDFSYWIKDNWPELIQSVLWVTVIMIMLSASGTAYNPEEFNQWITQFIPLLPKGVTIPVQLMLGLLTGLGINHIVYWFNKKKVERGFEKKD